MKNFFELTAWQMEKPTAYGAFHLIGFFVGLTCAIIFALLLSKNPSEKKARIVLGCCGGFLILTEVYKILFNYYVVNAMQSFPWWLFPFQLCSVPMYVCIFCAFCKNVKINNWLFNFLFAYNMFGGAISFTEPSGLHHPYVTLTLHAYIWHLMLVFIGLYLFFSKLACTKLLDYLKATAIFGIVSAIVQIINVCFGSFGGVNCFYISPYHTSPIFFFKDFYLNNGWIANMCLYLFAIILGAGIIYYLFYLFRYLKNKKIKG